MKTKTNPPQGYANRLWQARERRQLGQKQVASLLGYRQTEQLSRFEQGTRLPDLQHALALELIYGVPVRVLFAGLYMAVQLDLRTKAGRLLRPVVEELFQAADAQAGLEGCSYEELLRRPSLTPLEIEQVRAHVTRLSQQYNALR